MARIYSGIRGSDGSTVSVLLDPSFNHIVAAATYFTDDTYTTIATPTAGTLVIEGKVYGASGWGALDLSPLDCSDPSSYASTSIPLSEIRVVCSGLDDGLYFQVTITANSH